MLLCNFGTKADLFKMTSKAFHESSHRYFSHCISYLMPFKHIPMPEQGAYTSRMYPLTLASNISMHFSVWPGCPSPDLLIPRDLVGPLLHYSWAGILPPKICFCSILDQNTPLTQYCPNIWAFNTDSEQHGCLEFHLIGMISASGYL